MSVVPPIVFGPQVCGTLTEGGGVEREWLVTDGLGGYASGTVCGLRTRRYHGLLVVSADGAPVPRHVGLVALDPVLSLPSGAVVRLGVHEWASRMVNPAGHRLLERFELVDGLPRWRWRLGEVVVERSLAMEHGRPSLGVVHRVVTAPAPVRLSLEALCTWRDSHGERRSGGGPLGIRTVTGGVAVEDAYRLSGPGWTPAGEWYRDVYTREEAARGLNPIEDLWYAGCFTAELASGSVMEVSAWAGDLDAVPPPAREVIAAAHRRHREVVAAAEPATSTDATLVLAADSFVINERVPDVVAGYPWFGAWSRDTMISYEGLLLCTGRADEGRELLRGYAATLSEGMLANTADTGSTQYNTVDGTLWFLHAVDRHVTLTGDTDLAAELVPALDTVVAAHIKGTRYGIRVDPADGLLTQGTPDHALTWMDACVNGVPVTPRIGKAVEVNALWVNGLGALAELRKAAGGRGTAGDVDRLREQASTSFAKRFRAPQGWLYDVVDPDDPALRPNQLLAYSLPHAPLRGEPAAVPVLGEALLTPLGPRTLDPRDPRYVGRHRGDPAERDHGYHQGTVWPWLLGPYSDATGAGPELLAGIEAHLSEWGLGSVSETADGDPPHRATGCPFQAWSVAEVLRVGRAFTPEK